MGVLRSITLLWPGLPWLWLRGSLTGLVLALAFALAVDVAVFATWIWTELLDVGLLLALWTAVAAIWLASTASAAAAFPRPIPAGRDAATGPMFVRARDAYLARDWLTAETQLRTLLELAPTDGEAQLLHASLLRRTGRSADAKKALEKLARSDSGAPWRHEIAVELDRLAGPSDKHGGEEPAVLPLRDESGGQNPRSAAA
jgi:hypothetical protein